MKRLLFRKAKAPPSKLELPVLPALTGFSREGASLLEAMSTVTASQEYRQLARSLGCWPPNSQISTHERAVLHWLICETRARAVLEIGTAYAGTTLLLAASMLQAGRGLVHTIDPYGERRAPPILAAWPSALQEIVRFWPRFASDFFVPSLDVPPFDLVLIDGNHSYPNVMHDAFAAYEALRPGGFIVFDNAEQIDVLDAARDFVGLTPHSDAVRLVLTDDGLSGDYNFTLDSALDPLEADSAFVVVRKPTEIHLTRRALAFHLNQLRGQAVTGVEIVVVNPVARPVRLDGRISLRSLSATDTTAHELSERFGAEIPPGRSQMVFPFHRLSLPGNLDGRRVFVEANLAARGEGDELILESFKINNFAVLPGRNFMKPRG